MYNASHWLFAIVNTNTINYYLIYAIEIDSSNLKMHINNYNLTNHIIYNLFFMYLFCLPNCCFFNNVGIIIILITNTRD